MEDLPMVTTSRNRLSLSLSKCIRYELVTKINNNRRLLSYEALGRISMDHSCMRTRPSPHLATPRSARPDEVSEHACVFFPFSFPPHFCKCKESYHYLSMLPSISSSNVGLKSYYPSWINGPLRFIRNSLWARLNNSNNPHQIQSPI
jgi:hypothetical protein